MIRALRLTQVEQQTLLRAAREAIAGYVAGRTDSLARPPTGLGRRGGAFVSLHLARHLRGCIGCVEADEDVLDVVRRCAVSAASADPRFPPLTSGELALVTLEISVLGGLVPVGDVTTIEVGRHGLVVRRGRQHGVLLPQVAVEWQWDRDTFLAHACLKAGLPTDGWRLGAEIFAFEAEVFGEEPR